MRGERGARALGAAEGLRASGTARARGLGPGGVRSTRVFGVGHRLCGRGKGKQWPDAEALLADGVEYTAAGHWRPGSSQ